MANFSSSLLPLLEPLVKHKTRGFERKTRGFERNFQLWSDESEMSPGKGYYNCKMAYMSIISLLTNLNGVA